MKAGKEHRIPLSDRAVEILSGLPRHGKRVFPLSDMAMLKLLRGMRPGTTVARIQVHAQDLGERANQLPARGL